MIRLTETIGCPAGRTGGQGRGLDGEIQGFVTSDGNIIIWMDRIPEDLYEETGIAVGVKTN